MRVRSSIRRIGRRVNKCCLKTGLTYVSGVGWEKERDRVDTRSQWCVLCEREKETVARRLRRAKTTLACVGGSKKNKTKIEVYLQKTPMGSTVVVLLCRYSRYLSATLFCTFNNGNIPSASRNDPHFQCPEWVRKIVSPEYVPGKKISLFFYVVRTRPSLFFSVTFDTSRGHTIQRTHIGYEKDKR